MCIRGSRSLSCLPVLRARFCSRVGGVFSQSVAFSQKTNATTKSLTFQFCDRCDVFGVPPSRRRGVCAGCCRAFGCYRVGTCVARPVWLLKSSGVFGATPRLLKITLHLTRCLGNYDSLHLTLFVALRCPTSLTSVWRIPGARARGPAPGRRGRGVEF